MLGTARGVRKTKFERRGQSLKHDPKGHGREAQKERQAFRTELLNRSREKAASVSIMIPLELRSLEQLYHSL